MARQGVAEARRLLRAVLVGRFVFTPATPPPELPPRKGSGRKPRFIYELKGEASLSGLIAGLISASSVVAPTGFEPVFPHRRALLPANQGLANVGSPSIRKGRKSSPRFPRGGLIKVQSRFETGRARREGAIVEAVTIAGLRKRPLTYQAAGRRELPWRGVRLMRFKRITVDPRQMGGVPCLRGLRMPVATVVGMVADGMTVDEILKEHPTLEAEDISEALHYAAEAVRERMIPLEA